MNSEHWQLSVTSLSKTYVRPEGPIIDGVTFAVPSGTIMALVGRSGTGKTTVLKIIAGLLTSDGGSVETAGHPVGYLFQRPCLIPWLSVERNVDLPLRLRGGPIDRSSVRSVLASLSLEGDSERFPDQLSGGMQSRVAMARLFVKQPQILLLDEPTSWLDYDAMVDTIRLVKAYVSTHSALGIWVTHDMASAIRFADSIGVLGGKPARLVHVFSKADLERDAPRQMACDGIYDKILSLFKADVGR